MEQTSRAHLWAGLQAHFDAHTKNKHLRTLLADASRNQSLVFEHNGIILDLTHQKIDAEGFKLLLKLAEEAHLKQRVQAMFKGDHINTTQNRAVLHTALRLPKTASLEVDGKDIVKDVHKVLDDIAAFSKQVREGSIKGLTGKPLRNVVTIGIGGSYLSIEFVYEALRSEPSCKQSSAGRILRFLSNVDPIDFSRSVQGLNVEETLFVVNSKTFTTAETMLNARTCRNWLIEEYRKLGNNVDEKSIVSHHLAACSTNLEETSKFGIDTSKVFGFWDFVGGRFSVWSAIGVLPLSLHFGFDVMQKFLEGGHNIDQHLTQAPVASNLPLLLGLVGFYRISIQKYSARAILPYCQALCKFVPHIQQLDMESNGKRVNLKGEALPYETAVVNFGEPGTNGQHSFYQLLHQGRTIPSEFIGFVHSQQPVHLDKEVVSNHDELMSNFFSQPDALALGKTVQQLKAEKTPEALIGHKYFPGDRPSTSILFLGKLDPFTCGQLLALYEHRTSIEGFLWDVDSYDQWGVELGKILAKKVRTIFSQRGKGEANLQGLNSATQNLLKRYLSG